MEQSDKKILEYELAKRVGKAVSKWAKEQDVDENLIVNASKFTPTLYLDEVGTMHTGPLTVVDVSITNDDDDDDD